MRVWQRDSSNPEPLDVLSNVADILQCENHQALVSNFKTGLAFVKMCQLRS